MGNPEQDLVQFDRPPVTEVVVGVQFSNLSQALRAAHVGLFWNGIRDEYISTEDKPPLAAVYERFGAEQFQSDAFPQFGDLPPLRRSFMIDRTGHWVLQLQEDRLLHNWRRLQVDDEYPNFERCIEKFESAWSRFLRFCESEQLPTPQPDQLELTYMNHIPQGMGWSRLSEIEAVLPDLSWRRGERALPAPVGVQWQVTFNLPLDRTRLHASVKSGRRPVDKMFVLLCELTVRGAVPPNSDFMGWFAEARRWCNRAFADLTSSMVQSEHWGLRR